ncbi:MAG: SprB repeat-containing protein [Saprospiraceae bacterium]|nr:SprB repeat-containing protein [Saprospiraceae bacterium]
MERWQYSENSLQRLQGNYDVTITDAAGCLVSETLTLIQPDEISISGTRENNLCFGDKNGFISADIKGGTLPYSITWNVGNGIYNNNLFAGFI